MAYPINTGAILKAAGYEPLVDFICERAAGSDLALEWLHTDPQPTEQQIQDYADDTTPLPNGQTFTEYQTVPDEVTNYQLKRALNTVPADRAAVDALVAASGDQDTIDGWNNALTFKRTNPLFQAAIANLGWTQQKVNDYLILAKSYD
jgi:hypothetical protein